MTASRAVSPTRDTESGNMIELREHPESRHYQVPVETHVDGRGNDPGYGKNVSGLDNPQPSS